MFLAFDEILTIVNCLIILPFGQNPSLPLVQFKSRATDLCFILAEHTACQ